MFHFALIAVLAPAVPQQPAAAAIAMTVRTPAGAPLASATAHVVAGEFASDRLASEAAVRADVEGRLTIPVPVIRDGLTLVVVAPGHTTLELPLAAVVPANELGPVVLFPAMERTGRVRDAEGRPLAGARVRATDPFALFGIRGGRYASSTFSDERGFFRLRGVLPGSVELTFTKWGWHGVALRPVRAGVPVDVVLRPAGVTTGNLVDMPADARVELAAECPDAATCTVRQQADGSFEVLAPERGRYRVVVLQRGVRIAASGLLRGSATGVVVAALYRDHALEVRLTIDGRPARGFRILASWEVAGELAAESDRFLIGRGGRDVDGDVVTLAVPGWVGRGELLVRAAGAAPRRIVVWDASVSDRKYDLTAAGAIVGRAIDAATRAPLAGVPCHAVPQGGTWGGLGQLPGSTGADGRFHIDGVRAGDYRVWFDSGRHASSEPVDATVTGTATCDLGEIALTRDERALRGRFADQAVPRLCWVRAAPARPAEDHDPYPQLTEDSWPRVIVDAATKSFVLPDVRGEQDLALLVPPVSPAGPPLAFPFGGGQPGPDVGRFAVSLAAGAIRGNIRGAVHELPALRVFATSDDSTTVAAVAEADAGGNYELRLPVGEWRLHAVDLTTGLVVFSDSESTTVRAGETAARDLVVTLREVTVRIVPEREGGTVLAHGLRIHSLSDSVHGHVGPGALLRFAGEWPAIPLASGVDRVLLRLPAGEYQGTAFASPEALALRRGGEPECRATVTFAVDGESSTLVDLRMPAPPPDAKIR